MDEEDLNEVLSIQQRQKRAMIMRRYAPRIERARELAQKKMAPESNIRKRAYVKARQLVRKRVAGERGAEYEKLGPSEKMAIDRAVEGKQKVIKKLALRLIPKIKQAESKRLQTFMHGKAIEHQGQPEGKTPVKENLNVLFTEAFPPGDDTSSAMGQRFATPVATNSKRMPPKDKSKNPVIIQHNKFQEEIQNDTPAFTSLYNKSEKSGVDLETLGEVYNRGWNTWTEDCKVNQQQYAFARVNSYINQGKTYFKEDADLREAGSKYIIPMSYAFARVNSYINQGKTYFKEDADLREAGSKYNIPMSRTTKKAPTRTFTSVLDEVDVPPKHLDRARNVWNKTKDVAAVKKFVASVKEEGQQTNENFMDGKGPGKPGDSARHGLKGKSAAELKSIRSSDSASPRKKQLAHWMLNMHHNEETEIDEAGLWDNIHAKRKRIKAGSGERMRKPGSEGAPTKQNFRDASESIEEGYDVNSKHYKALTDLDLNTKNRDMTTKHDGYGPLNPKDEKGSKKFWEDKAKMWNTTVEAAREARCGNCAAFNQAPAIMKKMAEGLGPAGEKIQELSNLGFCELFEFKCAGDRTCNKWLVNGPITEEDTGNGTSLVDKESKNSRARKKIEVVDRKPPHTEYTRQAEIKQKVIDEKLGNKVNNPKNRLIGTNALAAAYRADTPGEGKNLDESFNIAFASGVGVTLTAGDLGIRMQGGFALHPSVVAEQEIVHDKCGSPECCGQCTVEEEVVSADVKGEVIPAHTKTTVDPKTGAVKKVTVPGHVRKAKKRKVIIGSGNVNNGEPG